MSGRFDDVCSAHSTRQLLITGTWHGWLWRRGRWHRVACTDHLGETSRLLSAAADEHGIPDSHSCLTRGDVPSWTPAERGQL
jgi:hypothetical protein